VVDRLHVARRALVADEVGARQRAEDERRRLGALDEVVPADAHDFSTGACAVSTAVIRASATSLPDGSRKLRHHDDEGQRAAALPLLVVHLRDTRPAGEAGARARRRAVEDVLLLGVHAALGAHLHEVPRVRVRDVLLPEERRRQERGRRDRIVAREVCGVGRRRRAGELVDLAALDVEHEGRAHGRQGRAVDHVVLARHGHDLAGHVVE
jgi:hypothetical protein